VGVAVTAAGIWLLLRVSPKGRTLDDEKRFEIVTDEADRRSAWRR
jgi:hypothetical protein